MNVHFFRWILIISISSPIMKLDANPSQIFVSNVMLYCVPFLSWTIADVLRVEYKMISGRERDLMLRE